ncbi:hypothetical protein [Pseudomonas sp. NGC7]|uniref:hypothetical protein n=1 Tax=Pseudomonas sp. NGC7 TaxID=3341775 RepID=UPI00399D56E5
MSDNDEDVGSLPQDAEPGSERHRVLTTDGFELSELLNEIAPDSKCSFCHQGEYSIVPAPSDDNLCGVVAASVPNMQKIGVWFYVATCMTCGHAALFNAHFLRNLMDKRKK